MEWKDIQILFEMSNFWVKLPVQPRLRKFHDEIFFVFIVLASFWGLGRGSGQKILALCRKQANFNCLFLVPKTFLFFLLGNF